MTRFCTLLYFILSVSFYFNGTDHSAWAAKPRAQRTQNTSQSTPRRTAKPKSSDAVATSTFQPKPQKVLGIAPFPRKVLDLSFDTQSKVGQIRINTSTSPNTITARIAGVQGCFGLQGVFLPSEKFSDQFRTCGGLGIGDARSWISTTFPVNYREENLFVIPLQQTAGFIYRLNPGLGFFVEGVARYWLAFTAESTEYEIQNLKQLHLGTQWGFEARTMKSFYIKLQMSTFFNQGSGYGLGVAYRI